MFEKAKAIWIKNKRNTKNLQVGFRCEFAADENRKYILRVTGATLYRVFLNGEFVGYGPARAGHGFLRVDEMPLRTAVGVNRLAVEVAGYNCSSFYTLPIKSFLCAEVLENGAVIKYTGKDFKALSLENLRNIYSYRYSYQRAYSEVWNFDNSKEITHWTVSNDLEYETTIDFDTEEEFIKRDVLLPHYNIASAVKTVEEGEISHKGIDIKNIRYIADVSNHIDGYLPEEITDKTISELYGDFKPIKSDLCRADKTHIRKDEYVIYKLPFNNTGFLMNTIKAFSDSNVYIFFAEHDYGNGMIFESFEGQVNIIKYNLKKSIAEYKLESFEPYTCQYIGIAVTEGEIEADVPRLREYSYPEYNNVDFGVDSEELQLIFDAAKETFRQNTLDIYMDCPSRERGGWLCDSYFTAQSEKFFTGKSVVENVFLNNFVMAKEFPNVPQGMLPMVYPSDIKAYNSGFIPQWAMWYVIELGELRKNRSKIELQPYQRICYDLLGWFEKYENTDGLLENMPGWNFVEWSKANDWVQDVNYPTNMLYSKMLLVIGELFSDDCLIEKAKRVKEQVLEQSFDGEYFVDNAIRNNNGVLIPTSNRSETCQYYAYFFDIADAYDKKFENLTNTILNIFGPERKKNGKLPDIAFSNAFIGNYLRIIILLRLKQFNKVISDISGYFLKMAKLTGTLWEYDDLEKAKICGSLNHGFASFAGVALAYALAGISMIDYVNKNIYVDKKYLSGNKFSLEIGLLNDESISISENNGRKEICIPDEWSLLN